MRKERNASFDFMKGILIVLVVLGHAISLMYGSDNPDLWYQPCFNVIYTFHMPLFVFVSGVFLRHSLSDKPQEFLGKRVKRLALPCVIYSTLVLLVYVCAHDMELPSPYPIYKCYCTYWYLVCVFMLSCVYYVFVRTGVYVRALLAVGYLALLLVSDRFPLLVLSDCQVVRQTAIFGLGVYLSDKLQASHGNRTWRWRMILLAVVCSVVVVCIVRLAYGVNMLRYPAPVRVVDGIACSALAYIMIKGLYRLLSSKHITKGVVWLGQNSLSIYLTHILLLVITRWACPTWITGWVGVSLWFLIAMAVSVVCIPVEKRLLKSKSFVLGV